MDSSELLKKNFQGSFFEAFRCLIYKVQFSICLEGFIPSLSGGFLNFSFAFRAGQLIYNTTPRRDCQQFFSKIFDFFLAPVFECDFSIFFGVSVPLEFDLRVAVFHPGDEGGVGISLSLGTAATVVASPAGAKGVLTPLETQPEVSFLWTPKRLRQALAMIVGLPAANGAR